MAWASVPIEDTNSRARRDFPIPASPITVSRPIVPERTTRRNADLSRVSSPWRPNIGASSARGMAGAPATISRICQPVVPVGAPSKGFMIAAPRRSRCAAGPTTHFAVRRGVLQSTRHPDQRPRNRIVNRGPRARDHDLSGFHARPRPVAAILRRSEAIVQPTHRCLCIGDGAQRSERVVLVRNREPEERDQRIPELALDAATVPLDHLGRNAGAAERQGARLLSASMSGDATGATSRTATVTARRSRGSQDPGEPGGAVRALDRTAPRAQGPAAGSPSRAHAARGRVRGPAPRRAASGRRGTPGGRLPDVRSGRAQASVSRGVALGRDGPG